MLNLEELIKHALSQKIMITNLSTYQYFFESLKKNYTQTVMYTATAL